MIVYRDELGHFASYDSYLSDTDGRISVSDVHYSWEDRQEQREGELEELDEVDEVDEVDVTDDVDFYEVESFDYDVGESEY